MASSMRVGAGFPFGRGSITVWGTRWTRKEKHEFTITPAYQHAPICSAVSSYQSSPRRLTTSPLHHLTTSPPHHFTTSPPRHLATSPPTSPPAGDWTHEASLLTSYHRTIDTIPMQYLTSVLHFAYYVSLASSSHTVTDCSGTRRRTRPGQM